MLGGAGAVTYAMADPSTGDSTDEVSRGKRPVSVHDIALRADGAKERELPRTSTKQFSLLGVSWTGVTKELEGTAQVRTRSIESAKWTGWQSLDLELHLPEKAEAGMRAASEPLWVGPSDGVEVRVVAADGTSSEALPKGLEVNLVDPGVTSKEADNPALDGSAMAPAAFAAPAADETTVPPDPGSGGGSGEPAPSDPPTDPPTEAPTEAPSSPTPTDPGTEPPTSPAPTGSPTASPDPEPTVPPAPPSTVSKPPILSRAAWGADESQVEDPPEYIDKVKAVFVHHTVGTNDYSCAQSASLVRGVMTYHVKTEGWNDLGYNFLVDKCGQVFEGRGGGTDLPVRGAHTYGFNGESAGIAVLGDFEGDPATGKPAGKPTRATLESVSRVAAWKLGQYGGDPLGKATLTAADDTGVWKKGDTPSLNTISGHRDGFATACPGKTLYAKLGEIRRYAASPARNSAIPTSDSNRDGITDLVAGTPKASGGVGSLTVVPGGLDGPVSGLKKTLTQSSPGVPGASEAGDNWAAATAWGDINGDGYADLAIGAPGEDDTTNKDRGAVTMLYGPDFTTGTDMQLADDFHYPGAKFGSAVAVGDFNADGKADVFAASTGTGGTWAARFKAGSEVGGTLTSGDTAISYADAASGDFNRDGYADVALNYRDQSGIGRVQWFKGTRSGLSRVGSLTVKGGRSLAVGDVNGNGYDDLVIGQPYTAESGAFAGGQVTVIPGTSTGFTTTGMKTVHQDTSGVPGAAESGDAMGWSVSAGDYNLDGYADVLAGAPNEDITRDGSSRKDAGTSLLLKGTSSGLTGTGASAFSQDTTGITGSTEAADRLGASVTLTDLSGYGRADLAIGVDGEDAGNGTILQLDSGSSGVSTSGGVYYGRTLLGTPAGAHLGETLTP
ncbi:FG-GAP-like repeat-containing protein [Streptomyces durmitorensis]|uniref:FG-GAP-like repeat-containing protein n=1 Tax=Streptomyces durmitorensis TaxID=319947 RepID=A0ABY4PTG7_9ACTN|nr:FG-GAP-like repeat-containing protein [Streptomyces durmitorensis]UQT56737.1 FG-GAP-like repeat-containing protein [Streptomyces durmitorensis]